MRQVRPLSAVFAASVLSIALGACGASNESSNVPPAAAPTPVAATSAPSFPATVQHRYGTTEIKSEPKRIVVVGLVEQDALLAMGVVPVATTEWFGKKPGAVFDWARDELGTATPPTVLDATDGIDAEAVAAQRPDLILGMYSGMTKSDYDTLSRLAPTVAQPGPVDYELNWRELTRVVGRSVGREAHANRIIDDLDQRFAQVRAQNSQFAGKDTVLATPYQGYGVYGPQDPRSRIMSDLGFRFPAGLEDITGASFLGNLSKERIDLLDTDVLVWYVETPAQEAEIKADALYNNLEVAKQDRAVFLDDSDEIYRAFQFSSVLSLPVLLDKLPPLLAEAVAGSESGSTPNPSPSSTSSANPSPTATF